MKNQEDTDHKMEAGHVKGLVPVPVEYLRGIWLEIRFKIHIYIFP